MKKVCSKMWFLVLLLLAFVTGCADRNGGEGAAALVSIVVAPASTSIPVTGTLQYTATAINSNGSSLDVTASTNWSSSSPGVTFGATKGLATGAIANSAPVVITATYSGLTATAALTVNAATSKGLRVTPDSATIPVTGTIPYTAIETFSDGSTFDRTTNPATIWSSSSVAKATIVPDGANAGLATGKEATSAGVPVVITATFGVGGPSATANLTVNSATSQGLTLTPASAAIPVTGTLQYTAIETFSDGISIDRTNSPDTTWISSLANATLSQSGADAGLATGKIPTSAGVPVVITATFGVGGPSATAELTVTAATSTKFEVTPSTATIAINGATQQFTAVETFSDGTSFDRTLDSDWSAVNAPLGGAAVATIGLNTGIATGRALGVSTITATYLVGGVTKTATATLNVNAPNPGLAGSVNLGTAGTYGMIASDAMTVTAAPTTHIYGDVALINNDSFVGFALTGVPPAVSSIYVTGQINSKTLGDPAVTAQAQADLNAAYNDLSGRPATTTFPSVASTELSGKRLTPGIYSVFTPTSQTLELSNVSGPLVLDAEGNPDAIFIFKTFELTTSTGSVILQNGAQPQNVFWLVTTDATIGNGASTFFQGTVVAGNTITVGLNTSVQGRMLAGALGAGAITNSGVITVPE